MGRKGGQVPSEGISKQHIHPGLHLSREPCRGGEQRAVGAEEWRREGSTQPSIEVHADQGPTGTYDPGMRTEQECVGAG